MSRASLEEAIPEGLPILLDTSALLAYLDGTERASPAAAYVLDSMVRGGRNAASISAVTAAELLVGPMRGGLSTGPLETFLREFPGLTVANVDYSVAREGAHIRALTRLPMPDALIIGTAYASAVRIVVTNDLRWRAVLDKRGPAVQLCHLGSHVSL